MKRANQIFLVTVLLLGGSVGVKGSDITVVSDNQGFIASDGYGIAGHEGQNTFTGSQGSGGFNSWASFELPVLPGGLTSATLDLSFTSYPLGSGVTYGVGIYDVNTSLSSLLGGSSGVAGYTDLQSGNLYGTTISNGAVVVTLSSQAIADISAHSGGSFVIGFTNTTLNGVPGPTAGFYINNWTGTDPSTGPYPTLVLQSVPEPASAMLLGTGAIATLCCARRRAKAV